MGRINVLAEASILGFEAIEFGMGKQNSTISATKLLSLTYDVIT